MRRDVLLPVLALLCGCATEAPLTGSVPETAVSSAALQPATPPAVPPAAAPPTGAPPPVAALPPAAPTAPTPVTLSRAQTLAIEDALWRALEDPAWVRLGRTSAGIGRDGVTVVCGTLKSRNSFGVFSPITPFRGEFRGREFKPAAVGGANAAATLAACEKTGIPISVQDG